MLNYGLFCSEKTSRLLSSPSRGSYIPICTCVLSRSINPANPAVLPSPQLSAVCTARYRFQGFAEVEATCLRGRAKPCTLESSDSHWGLSHLPTALWLRDRDHPQSPHHTSAPAPPGNGSTSAGRLKPAMLAGRRGCAHGLHVASKCVLCLGKG